MNKRAASDTTLWGEGFVEDGWTAMAGVGDFRQLSPDEYIRLFPGLVSRDGRWADGLPAVLAACVAARARRVRGGAVSSGDADGAADERSAQRFLEEVLEGVRAGDVGTADPTTTARFAFLSGLHPAYVWPGALTSHDRDAAAGWLGVVARGRPALMPAEVAAFFLDTIECRSGRPVAIRDASIASLLRQSADLGEVWRAARAQRLGKVVVVRRLRGSAWRGLLPALRRSLAGLDRLWTLTRRTTPMRNV